MTKHDPIDPPRKKRSSLLERADAAFGLGGMDLPSPPAAIKRAPERPNRKAEADPQAAPVLSEAQKPNALSTPAQPAEPARGPKPDLPMVRLNGPRQSLDREIMRAGGLIAPGDAVSGVLEEFRVIKRELLIDTRASGDPRARRILVSSPHPGEGKSFCAINLAVTLASDPGIEVLLIDADVVNPCVVKRLGIEGGEGLLDILADPSLRPEDCAIRTNHGGLFVLPAGSGGINHAHRLAGSRLESALDRLTRSAPQRVIILDTPPALAASPAGELAAFVGQCVLVVHADKTSRAALEDASHLLSACGDVKLLFNAAQFSPSGRRFGAYGGSED